MAFLKRLFGMKEAKLNSEQIAELQAERALVMTEFEALNEKMFR